MKFTALPWLFVAFFSAGLAHASIEPSAFIKNRINLATVTDFAAMEQIMPFEQIDKNQDGLITREEAKVSAWLLSKFEELDIDRDGAVSRFEYQAGLANQSPMSTNK